MRRYVVDADGTNEVSLVCLNTNGASISWLSDGIRLPFSNFRDSQRIIQIGKYG